MCAEQVGVKVSLSAKRIKCKPPSDYGSQWLRRETNDHELTNDGTWRSLNFSKSHTHEMKFQNAFDMSSLEGVAVRKILKWWRPIWGLVTYLVIHIPK